MPIAQKDSPGVAHLCQLLPGQACLPQLAHLATDLSRDSSPELEEASAYFSTHSPPILNLSPNLSPTESQSQRGSPAYDLRESTVRRRNMQEYGQQMQHSPHYSSGIKTEENRRSESPCRKRRKLSQDAIDLTASPSPPPPVWPTEMTHEVAYTARTRRNSVHQRRAPADQRCNTPRARRSPPTRQRRARERNGQDSPDRRAFQPLTHQMRHHGNQAVPQMQQPAAPVDLEQIGVPNPVTLASYGLPMNVGPHYVPICTTAHLPLPTSQPLRSVPGCVSIPTCGGMHVPVCALQHVPVSQALHPYLQTAGHSQPQQHYANHALLQHPHLQAQPHFMGPQHPMQAGMEDIRLLGDHRTSQYPHIPAPLPRGPAIHATPPVYIQEPTVHPQPQDIYNPFSRLRRSAPNRSRWRTSIPPPPPPYPGVLLQFLAMLGNPPVPPYRMDPNTDASEVENYEALLNLAERLGEAKPKGLHRSEIELLPKYYYNAEGRKATMDQTSCVVCMCDFENQQKLRVLPCSHEFHAKCVDKWLRANRTCPICRANASGGSAPEGEPSE